MSSLDIVIMWTGNMIRCICTGGKGKNRIPKIGNKVRICQRCGGVKISYDPNPRKDVIGLVASEDNMEGYLQVMIKS